MSFNMKKAILVNVIANLITEYCSVDVVYIADVSRVMSLKMYGK